MSTTISAPITLATITIDAPVTIPGAGGGGGGGATSFTQLTDKASANLPEINGPLATALSAKAPLLNPEFSGTVSAGSFTGNGSNLTQISAANITAGNIARARIDQALSANPAPMVASSLNKLTITQPATAATLTIADGKTIQAGSDITTHADGGGITTGLGGAITTGGYSSINAESGFITTGAGGFILTAPNTPIQTDAGGSITTGVGGALSTAGAPVAFVNAEGNPITLDAAPGGSIATLPAGTSTLAALESPSFSGDVQAGSSVSVGYTKMTADGFEGAVTDVYYYIRPENLTANRTFVLPGSAAINSIIDGKVRLASTLRTDGVPDAIIPANASTTRTELGLGTTDNVTFNSLTIGPTLNFANNANPTLSIRASGTELIRGFSSLYGTQPLMVLASGGLCLGSTGASPRIYTASASVLGLGTYNSNTPSCGLLAASVTASRGTTGVGTVTITAGALTTVTGTSTDFLSRFIVGDSITITTASGSETKVISAIASNTSMTTAAFTGTATGVAYTHTTSSGIINPSGAIACTNLTASGTVAANAMTLTNALPIASGGIGSNISTTRTHLKVPASDPTGIAGASALGNIVSLSQASYDALVTKDSATLYVIA